MKVLLDLNNSRNETDFAAPPVSTVSPTAFLALLAAAWRPTDGGEAAGPQPPQ